MQALDEASQKLNQQGGGDSVSSADKALQKEEQQKAQQKKEDDQALTASMEARRQEQLSLKNQSQLNNQRSEIRTPQPHNEPEQGISR